MSLKFKILNENSTSVNLDVETFRFYSGENRTLRVQIYTDYTGDPRPILAGGTISLTIPNSPADLEKEGIIDSTDRSIITVELSDTETTSMISGNLIGEIIEDGKKRIVKSVSILKKLGIESN